MDAQWIKSPTGRRIVEHWADPRPSWLWSADGQALLWRNLSARLFSRRGKAKAGRSGKEITPIKGQVARLIRLGSPNRASLSRMQFLSGDRPVSATCSCTPVPLPDGTMGLLVIDVDPIDAGLLEAPPGADATVEALLPEGADYLLIDDGGQVAGGTPRALELFAPAFGDGMLAGEGGTVPLAEGDVEFTRLKASPGGASLLLLEAAGPATLSEPAPVPAEPAPFAEEPVAATSEPLLPLGLPPLPEAAPPTGPGEEPWVEPLREPATTAGGLSSLFDRLADDSALFEPLRPDEDFVPPEPPQPDVAPVAVDAQPTEAEAPAAPEAPEGEEPAPLLTPPRAAYEMEAPVEWVPPVAEAGPELQPAPVAAAERDIAPSAQGDADTPTLFRVTGRRYAALATADGDTAEARAPIADVDEGEPVPPVAETTEPPIASDSEGLVGDAIVAAPAEPPLADDFVPVPSSVEAPAVEASPLAQSTIDALIAAAGIELPELPQPAPPEAEAVPHLAEATAPTETESPASADGVATPGATTETVERVSRYNFDELSRILNDRVGNGDNDVTVLPTGRRPLPSIPSATPEGALVTLGGETLVLNRLPLGIMVFRDQQVLFANRAITEMVGYESVEALRQAGLAAIFPSSNDAAEAGPVNHLTQRDGTLVPVTARLQSVSWQGKPALMLSASTTEVRTGHEAAVRAFAELLAGSREDGFIEASRSGVLSTVSVPARVLLGRPDEQWLGRPLSALIAPEDNPALREFLERPARFAETARPTITLKGADPDLELALFAQGQAGVISGYFGFLRRRAGARMPMPAAPQHDAEPGLLTRLSRGVRRPLNTVIGFSDLIGSAAFGPIDNDRYLEYARDIKTAGLEIAALVDELDDFSRLRDGRYTARPSDLDLVGLLESSAQRVRGQASLARVLVRTAISETLPRVRADRASLAQAVLNLLASAIDQTPAGGSVVLSAQVDDAGGIAINVRDSAAAMADLGERFVVFRDGVGRDGEVLTPVRSSVGLALTRALLAVNASSLSVDPAGGTGTLFSLTIPAENVVLAAELPPPAAS